MGETSMTSERSIALYAEELALVEEMRDKMLTYVTKGLATQDYLLKNPEVFSEELLGTIAMSVDWDYSGSHTKQEMYADRVFWATIAASGCLRTIKRSLKLCDWEILDITALKHIVARAIAIVMHPTRTMPGKRRRGGTDAT